MKVKDKVIVVTGAGSVLGRELALELLKRGARVAGIGRKEEPLNETKRLAENNGTKFSVHLADITDRKRVLELPKEIISKQGAIDGLINNAGIIQPFVSVNELEFDRIDKVIQVNFIGTLNMTKAFLPTLLERDDAHLVNVSSMGGFFPFPGQSIYGATKAAIRLLTEGIFTETLETNLHVSAVFPGAMDTDIVQNSKVKMTKQMKEVNNTNFALSPVKAAKDLLDGMESDKVKIFLGNDSKIMDKLYRLSPTIATKIFAKFIGPKILGKQ